MAINLHGEAKLVPRVELLKAERMHATQPSGLRAEHLRLVYSTGNRAAETQASISWEALAQLRSEMNRAGQFTGDSDILSRVLVPWALDQVTLAQESGVAVESSLVLDFGDAPKPAGVRETLVQ